MLFWFDLKFQIRRRAETLAVLRAHSASASTFPLAVNFCHEL